MEAAHNLRQPDASLAHSKPYFHMHTPPFTNVSCTDGMTVDNAGKLYVATTLGLQVFDPDGRCHFILSKPQNKNSQMSFSEERIATTSSRPARTKSTNTKSTPSEPSPRSFQWSNFVGSDSTFSQGTASRKVSHKYAVERG